MGNKLNTITNGLVIVLALGFLLAPKGPVGRSLTAWRTKAAQKTFLDSNWAELASNAQTINPACGEVKLVFFTDYQCPSCRRTTAQLEDLSAPIVLRHFPLRAIHPNAELAARISICAEGTPGWVQAHHLLYLIADSLDSIDWTAKLNEVTNLEEDCVNARATLDRLAVDEAFAKALRLRGTPALVFSDTVMIGTPSEPELHRRTR